MSMFWKYQFRQQNASPTHLRLQERVTRDVVNSRKEGSKPGMPTGGQYWRQAALGWKGPKASVTLNSRNGHTDPQ